MPDDHPHRKHRRPPTTIPPAQRALSFVERRRHLPLQITRLYCLYWASGAAEGDDHVPKEAEKQCFAMNAMPFVGFIHETVVLNTREQIGRLAKIDSRVLFEDDGASITAVEPESVVSAGRYQALGSTQDAEQCGPSCSQHRRRPFPRPGIAAVEPSLKTRHRPGPRFQHGGLGRSVAVRLYQPANGVCGP